MHDILGIRLLGLAAGMGLALGPAACGDDDDLTHGSGSSEGASETSTPLPIQCTFSVQHELSAIIPTVGIVTWSAADHVIESATIEFGPSTSYGWAAPVDLGELGYRTLLLGMKPSTEYHFRIVAQAGATTCVSPDYTLMTGDTPNGRVNPTADVHAPQNVAPGFIVTSSFVTSGGAGGPRGQIDIYDHEGDLVWWYDASISQISRAKMSYDGRWMYALKTNPTGSQEGEVIRVSLDGLREERLDIPTAHHDFTVTPDNGVVFIVGAEDRCDDLVKMEPDGTLRRLFRVMDAFGILTGTRDLCHTNSIQYNPSDDSFTFSSLHRNSYVKISAAGELIWVLGDSGTFSGDGSTWTREHGHQMLSENRLLFFNNGRVGSDSLAIEVELDFEAMTATRVWSYAGGHFSQTFGDVQRLPNGNTWVTYSNAGVMHEVGPAGEVVQILEWGLGGATGYATHRPTLYGPPPPSK